MIDLQSHILPGIDDGAHSMDISLVMARIAVADGIYTMACSPHINSGMYINDGPGIRKAVAALQSELDRESVALKLVQARMRTWYRNCSKAYAMGACPRCMARVISCWNRPTPCLHRISKVRCST